MNWIVLSHNIHLVRLSCSVKDGEKSGSEKRSWDEYEVCFYWVGERYLSGGYKSFHS